MRRKIIINACNECPYCAMFMPQKNSLFGAYLCRRGTGNGNGFIAGFISTESGTPIPDWCPLEPYPEGDVSFEPAVDSATGGGTGTGGIVLIGMPTIEWAPDNLTGYGGTEVDGLWYYTWEQAMNAAKEVGDGWRLPTLDEFQVLSELEYKWDDDRNGREFGGTLYLPAAGFLHYESGALTYPGFNGYYWSSSPFFFDMHAGCLAFSSANVYPLLNSHIGYGFSVRLVRDVDSICSLGMRD